MASETDAIRIDDLIIDEETGEILQLPVGIGDPLEWLTFRAADAGAAEKAWKAAAGMYKKAIGELLNQAGVRSMQTQHGTPGWRGRTTRTGRPDRLPKIAEEYELTRRQKNAILACASELDAKRLDELLRKDLIPREVRDALIDESGSSWVQISPAKPAPPEIERVKRP